MPSLSAPCHRNWNPLPNSIPPFPMVSLIASYCLKDRNPRYSRLRRVSQYPTRSIWQSTRYENAGKETDIYPGEKTNY